MNLPLLKACLLFGALVALFAACESSSPVPAMSPDASDAAQEAAVTCCPTGYPNGTSTYDYGGARFADGGCGQAILESYTPPGMECDGKTSHGTDSNGCDTVAFYLECRPEAGPPEAGPDSGDADASAPIDAAPSEGGASDSGVDAN